MRIASCSPSLLIPTFSKRSSCSIGTRSSEQNYLSMKLNSLIILSQISSIPIVRDTVDLQLLDCFSRSDVRVRSPLFCTFFDLSPQFLASGDFDLTMTVGAFLQQHNVCLLSSKLFLSQIPHTFFGCFDDFFLRQQGRVTASCLRDDSLWTVTGLMVASQKHSIMVITQQGHLEGVVSLTDLLSFLTNRSPPTDQRIANLKQHEEEDAPTAVLFERDTEELQQRERAETTSATAAAAAAAASSSSSEAAFEDSGIARDEDFLA